MSEYRKILESLVSELELMMQEAEPGTRSALIDLHGALLLYELDGRTECIPTVHVGFGVRRILEFRVSRAARRLAATANDPGSALTRSVEVIEDLIHLIDEDLRTSLAA